MNKYFLDLEPEDIEKEILALGENRFRANQLIEWVYKKRIESFAECSNLPALLRNKLDKIFFLRSLKLKDKKESTTDGTARYGFLTSDKLNVYTVFLPKRDRNSICLSVQIGCPIKCKFCFSGKVKFRRNLTRGEIIEQIMQIEKEKGVKINSVLLMGMGEPLLNYENVTGAIRSLIDFKQIGISRKHVTISTVGLVPQIRKLADELLGIRLAISLHAPTDSIRKSFISEKVPYSVKEILKAGLYFSRKNNSHLTIEYLLISGINDTPNNAKELFQLIEKSAKPKDQIQVNLIPYNDTKGEGMIVPQKEAILRFKNYLIKNNILAMIRESRGADIGSACGQLGI
ncbi:MAG: 23S rRNA (adenine(2503)-C(2))-methyltransferase RlmN [Elusimicrobia bacterium]|nr:23S rRNA (adenine(2503)-C(2))-methyltransferase RlmN [Elusimicrobiota bacterium]